MLIILAKGVIRPDKREEFIAAAREQIVETRKEPGCIAYDFYESQTSRTRSCSTSAGNRRRRSTRISRRRTSRNS